MNRLKNKKKLILLICILLVVLLFIGFLLIKSNNKLNRIIKNYNELIETYNDTSDNYFAILKNNGCEEAVIAENRIVYEVFKDNKIRYIFNSKLQQQLMQDSDNLEKKIAILNENINIAEDYFLKVTQYNEMIDNYNNIVQEYYELCDMDILNQSMEDKLQTIENYVIAKNIYVNTNLMKQESDIVSAELLNLNSKIEFLEDKKQSGEQYLSAVETYNLYVDSYNAVAEEYNKLLKITSVDYITGMPNEAVEAKTTINVEKEKCIDRMYSQNVIEAINTNAKQIEADTSELLGCYMVANQITQPDEKWIIDRLNNIEKIIGIQAVTEENDPTNLWGREGAFVSCLYFTVSGINAKDVRGDTVLEKGTDGGGAIEVYRNAEDAYKRCEYLAQFNNTLINPGSFTVVGTMVIRTSYKLSEPKQIKLTGDIIREMLIIE